VVPQVRRRARRPPPIGLVGPPPCGCIPDLPTAEFIQNEPAPVEFDRNLKRISTKQGNKRYETEEIINTTNASCYGGSGSPVFLRGTDFIAGVLSYGSFYCVGGGNTYSTRIDHDLAMGILTGTVTGTE
jgi:hypothetical protein